MTGVRFHDSKLKFVKSLSFFSFYETKALTAFVVLGYDYTMRFIGCESV